MLKFIDACCYFVQAVSICQKDRSFSSLCLLNVDR